jgi:hypothetical protein
MRGVDTAGLSVYVILLLVQRLHTASRITRSTKVLTISCAISFLSSPSLASYVTLMAASSKVVQDSAGGNTTPQTIVLYEVLLGFHIYLMLLLA